MIDEKALEAAYEAFLTKLGDPTTEPLDYVREVRAAITAYEAAKSAEPVVTDEKLYVHGLSLQVARSLVEMFGGDETDMTVSYWREGHSGPGFYCWCTEYPEDGSSYLGPASEYSYLSIRDAALNGGGE